MHHVYGESLIRSGLHRVLCPLSKQLFLINFRRMGTIRLCLCAHRIKIYAQTTQVQEIGLRRLYIATILTTDPALCHCVTKRSHTQRHLRLS